MRPCVGRCDHPNIVTVHDVVIEDGVPWIIMQLVRGRSLQQRLRVEGRLRPEGATRVAEGLLKALEAAHRAGIVHRDIKPANVLLAPVLTDLRIAVHEADATLTATGAVIGSAAYMAPERPRGEKGGPLADLFSLGVTLHEAVEGTSPFARDSAAASLQAIAYEEPPPLRHADVLEPLITQLLANNPGERPSATEALNILSSAYRFGS
ncbi:serine/threonine-protein kinase [Streptomyces sp. URMC 129]|uniref:serine/threonine-protein kinase n=1 Tax=Streptomyces sp. URMC 129 TaxID=3423407 RepID=UPI003F1DEF21